MIFLKLLFNAIIKNTQEIITELDIARFHFNDGELYGILTWEDKLLSMEDIEVLNVSLN